MDLRNGVKKRPGARKSNTSLAKSKRSRASSRASKTGRTVRGGKKAAKRTRTKRMTIPKTASIHSKVPVGRLRMSRASNSMSLTDLQFLAKDRGIPFGGLSRAKLIKKINNYMY